LTENSITREDFEKAFLEHMSYKILKTTKDNLERTKNTIFGNKRDEFDNQVSEWKNAQRERVIQIGIKIVANPPIPLTQNEETTLKTYLEHNKKVFIRGTQNLENRYIEAAL